MSQKIINECYEKAFNDGFLENSNMRANQEQYLWFIGHRDVWAFKGKHDGYDRWEKRGLLEEVKE